MIKKARTIACAFTKPMVHFIYLCVYHYLHPHLHPHYLSKKQAFAKLRIHTILIRVYQVNVNAATSISHTVYLLDVYVRVCYFINSHILFNSIDYNTFINRSN